MNYNKKFNVGSASLAEPFFDYYHTLPLVAFGDVKGSTELSLVYNSMLAEENHFNIGNGFKLNLQKKLLINGTTIQLVDSNGIKLACNQPHNGAASYGQPAYAISDNSHRMLRRTTTGYDLEYSDFSKETFDSAGKLTGLTDKYGEEILRYVYDSNNRLASIIYRPQVNVAYKVLSFVYNTETSMLSSISYSGANETLLVCSFVAEDNGLVIKHYSGVDYVCAPSDFGMYAAFSKEKDATTTNEHSARLACVKNDDQNISIAEFKEGSPYDSKTFVARRLSENNEIIVMDVTDFHGIKKRIQYENRQPKYSYEINSSEAPITFTDGVFKGRVSVQGFDGANGGISPDMGYEMSPVLNVIYSLQFGDDATSSVYSGNAAVCGWIKSSNDVTFITLMNRKYYIEILQPNEWQYFMIPFENESSTIAFSRNPLDDFEDIRVVFFEKYLQDTKVSLVSTTLSKTLNLRDLRFDNIINGHIDTAMSNVTFEDIVRYFIAVKKYGRTNEFYFNGGRNFITNVENIEIRKEHETEDGTLVTETFSLSDFNQLTNSIICQDITKTERYYFDEKNAFMTIKRPVLPGNVFIKYDSNLDLIEKRDISTAFLLSHNYLLESYTRNSLGLITSHTVNGNITKQYTYNENCTKLLSMTDEFGTVTTYTTDDLWGNVTSASIEGVTETNSTYTSDGTDLKQSTFGVDDENTNNNITYANGKVSAMSSGGVSYTFGYTTNDLTSIAKNGSTLKNIAYEDDYKKVTVSSPTSSSASYSKIATSDNYGREISISDCRENTYALSPYFNESNQHLDYGDGKGSNSLKTTKDLTNNQITHFGKVNGDKDRIVTKSGTNTISTTNIEKDLSGRMVERTFNSTTTGEIKDEITYASFEHMWDTDNRVDTHIYSIGGQQKASTSNIYNGYKRLDTKTSTINDIDFSKDIWYNKSRISRVIDEEKINGDTTEISDVSYSYDALGRIVGETDSVSGMSKSYEYDSIGRLVRENNQELNKTYTYEYDVAGNVKNRKTYAYTTGALPSSATTTDTMAYSTTCPDRLMSYKSRSITYDQQGCPLSYNNKTLTWIRGKLTKVSSAGKGLALAGSSTASTSSNYSLESCTFTYNGNGQRTQKRYTSTPAIGSESLANILTNETIDYTYDHCGRLIHEKISRTMDGFTSGTNITYLYDCNTIIGIKCNSALYYFERNIQGDVVGVYDSTGTKIVTFKYDAFGRCTVSGDVNLAQWCRIRYRGYYYDTETGLYWVRTRYYNPDWCRWISPDSISYLDSENPHGLNLYLYCGNDPVNYIDPTGQFVITLSMVLTAIGIGAAIGVGIGLGTSVAKDLENGKLFDGDVSALTYVGNMLGCGVAGAGIGLCSVLGAGLGVSIATGTTLVLGGTALSAGSALAIGLGGAFVAGGIGYTLRTGFSDQESFEWNDLFIEASANATSGFLTFFSAVAGGLAGVKIPGSTSLKNTLIYHACVFGSGIYALKALIAYVKKFLKENL